MAKTKSKRRSRSLFGLIWKSGLIAGVLAVLVLVGAVLITMSTLPSFGTLMKSPNGQAVRIVARDGTVLVNQGPSYGGWLSYEEIPDVMTGAMLAVEDRRYFSHFGVDFPGLARALWVAARDGDGPRATSTITQQLARNLFLTNERTMTRKAHEALLALAMEQRFSKEEILELYLNRVYFGGGAYGIDAASRRFFGHSATELSPAEAAIIAGLVKAPSRFAPSSDAERARDRAGVVAITMERDGVVASASELQADIRALEFAPQPRQNNVRYFTDWVLANLDELVTERVEPLVVTTTLDVDMQLAAEAAIQDQTPESAQGALVSMTPTGEVRAMMGGRDYVTSNYNRATVAERQPGSAWKLFVYLTAIESGFSPRDYVNDAPVTIDGWTPRNYGRGHRGQVTLRQAFAGSYNTVAAQLGQRIGFSNVAMMARRLGIETDISRQPAMTLGSSTVRLMEMTAAYASVANGGRAVEPIGVLKVETAGGRTLYQRPGPSTRIVLSPWVVTNMTHLLESVITSGTGRAAAFGKPAAGKTGTTSNYQDGYFVGFTPELVTGVWMGRDDNSPVQGLTGGSNPARAFSEYMRVATRDMPATPLNSDIGEEEDFFAEPDMEVYGLDEWSEFGDYEEGEPGAAGWGEYDYDPETGVAVRTGDEQPYGAEPGSPRSYPADPSVSAELPSDLRARDVPTRPRRADGWLDEPVQGNGRRTATPGAGQQQRSTGRRVETEPSPAPAPAEDGGPTSLLPPEPME